MHAYFPALNSFPSLLGDMLADAIGCLGFTWVPLTFFHNYCHRHCHRHRLLERYTHQPFADIGYNTVWSELCECIRANSLQTVL